MKTRINVEHSFGLDHDERDSMTGARPLARGWCYPQGEWFSMTIGRSNDSEHITWHEWDKIVAHVSALREVASKKVTVA